MKHLNKAVELLPELQKILRIESAGATAVLLQTQLSEELCDDYKNTTKASCDKVIEQYQTIQNFLDEITKELKDVCNHSNGEFPPNIITVRLLRRIRADICDIKLPCNAQTESRFIYTEIINKIGEYLN